MYYQYERAGLKTYRIFISHSWDYHKEYYRLVDMLNDAPRFKWQNYSVPKHDALDTATDRELEAALRNQISPTHIVIILAGMYVNHRKWIQKEIEIAQDFGKPIIGVVPWGGERTPTQVSDAAEEMVRWNTDSIVGAIRRHSL
mgnify:CR=1 FL=1